MKSPACMKAVQTTAVILTLAGVFFAAPSLRTARAFGAGTAPQKVAAKGGAVDAQAERVLSRSVQALGGEAAIRSIHSYSMTGTVEVPAQGMTGTFKSSAKAPNRFLVVIELGGIGEIKQGFDGSIGWAQDAMSGTRQLSGSELDQTRRDSDLYRDLEMKKLYTSIKYQGEDKVDGKSVQVLVATPPEGGTEKLYYDAQTGLMVRKDSTLDSPQGKFPIQVYTEDYRSVNGSKVPFLIRQVTPMGTFVIKISEVKANVAVEDSVFAKP